MYENPKNMSIILIGIIVILWWTYSMLNSLRSACTSLHLLYIVHITVTQSLYSLQAFEVDSSTSWKYAIHLRRSARLRAWFTRPTLNYQSYCELRQPTSSLPYFQELIHCSLFITAVFFESVFIKKLPSELKQRKINRIVCGVQFHIESTHFEFGSWPTISSNESHQQHVRAEEYRFWDRQTCRLHSRQIPHLFLRP